MQEARGGLLGFGNFVLAVRLTTARRPLAGLIPSIDDAEAQLVGG